MHAISEQSYENWNVPYSASAPITTPGDEENFSTRHYVAAKPSIPRASQKIVCTQNIKSILERVLLTVTDFFSCSSALVTKRLAIEQDLNQMLQSPHKMKLDNWDIAFDKRCADARWYGVDVDSVIYQAFLSMESHAATSLKSVCEKGDSLGWLQPAIESRTQAHGAAVKKLATLLSLDPSIKNDEDDNEIARIFQGAVADGCNIRSIVDSLIAGDSLRAFRLLTIASNPHGAYSSLFDAVNEAVCGKLLSDDKVFNELLDRNSMQNIDKIFGLLNPHLSGASSEKAAVIHLTWAAKNRLDELDKPGAANGNYTKFERFIHASGCKPNEIRRIFALAAAKHVKTAPHSAAPSASSPNGYDKWLIDARHAGALSDDKLVKAFDDGLYGLPTMEIGISSEDMAVLKAEAGRRAESSETDLLVTLTSAATGAILMDSVWYLLPAVLLAEKHDARMKKFQELSFFEPGNTQGEIVEKMVPRDRQRIIQCLNYLSGKLHAHGETDAAKFLTRLLPKIGSSRKCGTPRKSDRKMIVTMLARHLSKESNWKRDFECKKFSPSELASFQESLTKSHKEISNLSQNSSHDAGNPFCEQFKVDNRGFHIWIGTEPMDGFSGRTPDERSQAIIHALISRLQISKEQAMTVSRLCTQDVSNQVISTMAEKKIFLMHPADEESLGLHGPLGERALTPMVLPMEQIVSKTADGILTVKYFLFKDNLAAMSAAPYAVLLDPDNSAFCGELTFSIQANGEFNVEGDVVLGLKKIIVGVSE